MENLDFLKRLNIGFAQAIGVSQLAPCIPFGLSLPIDELYHDVQKTADFPNPWHIGTFDSSKYPVPHELIQGELELIAHMFTMVVVAKPKLIVETGTNIGLTARALGLGCWVNGFGRVVTSDTDERMCAWASDLCRDLPVEVRCCPSLDLPELVMADLVFIDSSYESRVVELQCVKSGALYVMHDTYAEPWARPSMQYERCQVHIDTPRGFSIVRKQ